MATEIINSKSFDTSTPEEAEKTIWTSPNKHLNLTTNRLIQSGKMNMEINLKDITSYEFISRFRWGFYIGIACFVIAIIRNYSAMSARQSFVGTGWGAGWGLGEAMMIADARALDRYNFMIGVDTFFIILLLILMFMFKKHLVKINSAYGIIEAPMSNKKSMNEFINLLNTYRRK